MRAFKAIRFEYSASEELVSLFEQFRLMCNDAIRIAVENKPKNRFALIKLAYERLKEYGLHTHYQLSACEVAFSTYRNKNRKADPYVERAFLKLDNQSYLLFHQILRIPSRPRHFIYLTLKGSNYQFSHADNMVLKRGSITITGQYVIVAFSKEVSENESSGYVGVDVNEGTVTTSDTSCSTIKYDTTVIAELKERYRGIRAKIGQRTRQDRRVSQFLFAKYGGREKNRTRQTLHRISKEIVQRAKSGKLRIVMEDLKGIRKLYRRGNGQGKSYRGRMNSWTFYEIQRQIKYKAEMGGNSSDIRQRERYVLKMPRLWLPTNKARRTKIVVSFV